jgi:predicted HD phosphohydrolase
VNRTVSFRQMKEGTREDYLLLEEYERGYVSELPQRVLDSLLKLDGSFEGYQVSRLQHSLQCATRAHSDGADEELVVGALVHDIGDELSPYNHAEIAAGILRPYVRAEVTWIIEQHGLFQSYYYAHHYGGDRHGRERLRAHPWFQACADFCERWDQSSFDPDYASKPLAFFEPMLRRVLSRKPFDPARTALSA